MSKYFWVGCVFWFATLFVAVAIPERIDIGAFCSGAATAFFVEAIFK